MKAFVGFISAAEAKMVLCSRDLTVLVGPTKMNSKYGKLSSTGFVMEVNYIAICSA